MKREAVGGTKMKRLCHKLNVRIYTAVGILESLWHLTAREAPQGDIGKLSNEDIALGIDWEGDADQLVDALVYAKWLDRVSGKCRLLVHDWHEHADDAVDLRLARAGLYYATGQTPRMKRLGREEKAQILARYANAVRTEAHESALPVPEPEPVPEPVPEPGAGTAPPQAATTPPSVMPRTPVIPISQRDPDAGGELALASWLLEESGVPAEPGLIRMAAECVRLWAKENAVTLQQSSEWIAQQATEARCRGETVNRFWFSDQRYRPVTATKTRKQLEKEARIAAFRKGVDDEGARA